MAQTKVSSKYQIVIPKSVREKVGLTEGQSLHVYPLDQGILLTKEKRWPEDYLGSEKDFWAKIDVAKYLQAERDSWD